MKANVKERRRNCRLGGEGSERAEKTPEWK
jgi:hypothetical protein